MKIGSATIGAAAIGACAVCCAPLIAPGVVAAFAAGGVGLVIADELWWALPVAAGFGGYLLHRRKSGVKQQVAATACHCAPEKGCGTGTQYKLPDR